MADVVQIAYVYLNRRERTVAEVRTRLAKVVEKGDATPEEAHAAVEELIDLGYLDDARYARLFIEDKRNLENWGTERIERGLLERGVDRDVVAAAFSESRLASADGPSELERAVELLGQRYRAPAADQRERERAFGMLVRKGYGAELAADAIRAWTRG